MKKIGLLFLAYLFVFNSLPAFAEPDVTISLNGRILSLDQPPVIQNSGADVSWDDKTSTVIITKDISDAPLALDTLEISKGYPKVIYFRPAENAARRGMPYEEWYENFSNYNGVIGKVLNEELKDVTKTNVEIFTRFKRGNYNTQARDFSKAAFIAPHIAEFNLLPNNDSVFWAYNLSTEGPRDEQGRNGIDALSDDIAGEFGGRLSVLDGIEFDVHLFEMPVATFDANCDGVRDPRGNIAGTGTYSQGSLQFARALRTKMPNKLIMADGHKPDTHQRSFGFFNGMESEGWPDTFDTTIENWSEGINRFLFWDRFGAKPSFSYAEYPRRPKPF